MNPCKNKRHFWGVFEDDNGDMHVAPIDGGKHFLDDLCFCEPIKDKDTGILYHNIFH